MRQMSSRPLKIVSIGECTIDHYIDLNQHFVGGISLNFAVHCKRSGAEEVSLISRMGKSDEKRILQKLAKEKVDSSHVQALEKSTARQNILLTAHGDRIFPTGGYDPGVLQDFQLNEDEIRFAQSHNIVASAMFEQLEPLFCQTMSIPFDGWRVADFLDLTDYNKNLEILERFIGKLTIGFISGDHELIERLRPLTRKTRCLIVVTLGKEGSAALIDGEPIYQPSFEVDTLVDSTGCGDAFQAAFTVSYWREQNIERALESGSRHAASVIQHLGASG
jgi:sugar/nucleoside kinase (ribokinase family)